MRRFRWIALLTVACLLFVAADAMACPTCKDGLQAADSEGANIARGYFYSILLMLAMPFTLAGSFGLYVWREMRRQRQAGEQAGSTPLPSGHEAGVDGPPGEHHATHLSATPL